MQLVRYGIAMAWLVLLMLLMIVGGAAMLIIWLCGMIGKTAKRAAGILALCGVASSSASLPDTFAQRAMAHERPWNLFIRRLAGCPDYGDVSRRVCTLGSRIDLEQFRKSCETARALWALKGDCK